jgi:SAM-dependent methyltransferase
MLNPLANAASRGLAWMKRSQRLDPGSGPVRVNLGSALAVVPGWVHIDSSPNALLAGRGGRVQAIAYRLTASHLLLSLDEYRRRLSDHRFVHHDLKYGIPFPDASVDFVYSSHFLEHLDRPAALGLLKDCYRVLRPSGVIRICVPDLAKVVQFYLHGERPRFLAYFFTDQRQDRDRHRFMYDFDGLRDALSTAGFICVTQCGFQSGRTPDLSVLDNRSDETLYVEAMRSG